MFTISRHCERSEAIQPRLPRRLGLLAITMVIFIVTTPAYANAFNRIVDCMEHESREARIAKASLIFEGHLSKQEIYNSLILENKDAAILLVELYIVDKNWKGTKVGQEVRVLEASYRADQKPTIIDMSQKPKKALLVLQETITEKPVSIYKRPYCPDGVITHPSDINEYMKYLDKPWNYWFIKLYHAVLSAFIFLINSLR